MDVKAGNLVADSDFRVDSRVREFMGFEISNSKSEFKFQAGSNSQDPTEANQMLKIQS